VPEGRWSADVLPGERAVAWQRADGRVVVRAATEEGVERARFMLALDLDTTEFARRFSRDPLIGPAVRLLPGLRYLRLATVAHAVLRAVCGQLVAAPEARRIERRVLRAVGGFPSEEALGALAPAEGPRFRLATHRLAAVVSLCRGPSLERLHRYPTPAVRSQLEARRELGPWSSGVVVTQGLGRVDHGIVGDLALVKLQSSLVGRWVEPWETAELLAPYGEWQGLAALYLLTGFHRGLVPGASLDHARALHARRAA
jgi:3-methyladenine DNA glycosylase/8-oxoguanine DNA glycosylase